jgi:hypothetical protein
MPTATRTLSLIEPLPGSRLEVVTAQVSPRGEGTLSEERLESRLEAGPVSNIAGDGPLLGPNVAMFRPPQGAAGRLIEPTPRRIVRITGDDIGTGAKKKRLSVAPMQRSSSNRCERW